MNLQAQPGMAPTRFANGYDIPDARQIEARMRGRWIGLGYDETQIKDMATDLARELRFLMAASPTSPTPRGNPRKTRSKTC